MKITEKLLECFAMLVVQFCHLLLLAVAVLICWLLVMVGCGCSK